MCSVPYVQELCVGIMENAIPCWKALPFCNFSVGATVLFRIYEIALKYRSSRCHVKEGMLPQVFALVSACLSVGTTHQPVCWKVCSFPGHE